ncbi:MAG: radical SAM-associated putative lipoprotein [Paludibacteraceae bacterium]|nr:radical SAM-associated putative lipoprotein [Paludibacteraceae bacterium]
MKNTLKFSTFFVFFVLSMFSCDLALNSDEPNADYQVKGVITDSVSGNVLTGIRVILECPEQAGNCDTIFTDSKGKYDFSFNSYPFDVPVFKLKIDDVDGVENNGIYTSRVLEVQITSADWVDEGDDFNYYGKAVKTVDLKLTTLVR